VIHRAITELEPHTAFRICSNAFRASEEGIKTTNSSAQIHAVTGSQDIPEVGKRQESEKTVEEI